MIYQQWSRDFAKFLDTRTRKRVMLSVLSHKHWGTISALKRNSSEQNQSRVSEYEYLATKDNLVNTFVENGMGIAPQDAFDFLRLLEIKWIKLNRAVFFQFFFSFFSVYVHGDESDHVLSRSYFSSTGEVVIVLCSAVDGTSTTIHRFLRRTGHSIHIHRRQRRDTWYDPSKPQNYTLGAHVETRTSFH